MPSAMPISENGSGFRFGCQSCSSSRTVTAHATTTTPAMRYFVRGSSLPLYERTSRHHVTFDGTSIDAPPETSIDAAPAAPVYHGARHEERFALLVAQRSRLHEQRATLARDGHALEARRDDLGRAR